MSPFPISISPWTFSIYIQIVVLNFQSLLCNLQACPSDDLLACTTCSRKFQKYDLKTRQKMMNNQSKNYTLIT